MPLPALDGGGGGGAGCGATGCGVELPPPEDPADEFADDELLGIPHRIVVAERALDRGVLEYRHRRATDSEEIGVDRVVEFLRERMARSPA